MKIKSAFHLLLLSASHRSSSLASTT